MIVIHFRKFTTQHAYGLESNRVPSCLDGYLTDEGGRNFRVMPEALGHEIKLLAIPGSPLVVTDGKNSLRIIFK